MVFYIYKYEFKDVSIYNDVHFNLTVDPVLSPKHKPDVIINENTSDSSIDKRTPALKRTVIHSEMPTSKRTKMISVQEKRK